MSSCLKLIKKLRVSVVYLHNISILYLQNYIYQDKICTCKFSTYLPFFIFFSVKNFSPMMSIKKKKALIISDSTSLSFCLILIILGFFAISIFFYLFSFLKLFTFLFLSDSIFSNFLSLNVLFSVSFAGSSYTHPLVF